MKRAEEKGDLRRISCEFEMKLSDKKNVTLGSHESYKELWKSRNEEVGETEIAVTQVSTIEA